MEPERRNYCTYCDDYGHDALDHSDDRSDKYLGPLCQCGHHEQDHHISWFMSSGYKLVEECEWWGYNETGGMELTGSSWIEHCNKFRRLEDESPDPE